MSPAGSTYEMRQKMVAKLWTGQNRALMSMMLYSLSTTLLNLVNKVVFSKATFNYPWGTLAFQNMVSLLVLMGFLTLTPGDSIRLQPDLVRQLLFPMWSFIVFLYSNAKALRFISLPVLTVLKSFAPLGVSIMEVVFFKDGLTGTTALCMLLVVTSNYITASNDVEFSLEGYAWAGVNVASNIAYLISLRKCLSDGGPTTLVAMHSTLVSLAFIIPVAIAAGDFPNIVFAIARTSTSFQLSFAGSGILAAGITISTFWCLAETNGATLSFLGAMNKVPIVLLGAYLFNTELNTLGWVGIFLSIVAGYLFARSKALEKLDKIEERSSADSSMTDGADVHVRVGEECTSEEAAEHRKR